MPNIAVRGMSCHLLSGLFMILVLMSLPDSLSGQSRRSLKANAEVEKASLEYQKGNIDQTRIYLERALALDSNFIAAHYLIVDMALDGHEILSKRKSLLKILDLVPQKNVLAYKLLANDYFDSCQYKEALNYYSLYQELCPNCDSVAVSLQKESCNYVLNQDLADAQLDVEKLDSFINYSGNEYWPALSADDSTLYFTRLEDKEGTKVELIYSVQREEKGFSSPTLVFEPNRDFANIGAMSVSSDGKMMFFTACGKPGGKGSCDIYMVVKIDGKWTYPLNIGSSVNTKLWEAQPSVSSDGRWLYFSSNREGGLGGMDLWVSEIKQTEQYQYEFSRPKNMGRHINTPFDDYSPFIHADGKTLYFASKGWPRLGHGDLFKADLSDLSRNPQNLGKNINSSSDDFGLVVSSTGEHAYFVSDRDGSRSLYEFNPNESILEQGIGYLKGFVRNAKTHENIRARIEVTDLSSGYKWHLFSDEKEGYLITLNPSGKYAINVTENDFLFYSKHIDIAEESSYLHPQWFVIELDPVEVNSVSILNNVFFDFDSAELLPESFVEIENLSLFLKENPSVIIEIGGHTDNVGSEKYNQSLSEQRAKALADAIAKTAGSFRIRYRGYGASTPVASNDTEEGRAKNRRSEVRIVEITK